MSTTESHSFITEDSATAAPRVSREPGVTVVWLDGEQDSATIPGLCDLLAAETESRDVDIIVDLSAVTFMDGSTIGGLLRCKHLLQARRRWLTLRSPTPSARRLLAICDLGSLLDAAPPMNSTLRSAKE